MPDMMEITGIKTSRAQHQEIANKMYAMLFVEGLKDIGLVKGGHTVDRGKCENYLEAAKKFGITPDTAREILLKNIKELINIQEPNLI